MVLSLFRLTALGGKDLNSPSSVDFSPFDRMSRDELVAKARSLGVERPEVMTKVELTDEIMRRGESDPLAQKRARGWFGVARDLVASVVESGLNLPDAAAVIRGERGEHERKGPAPVATVTLAEIYSTQGHLDRALLMLEEVLATESDHPAALRLRERLRAHDGAAEPVSPPAPAQSAPPAESAPPADDTPLEVLTPPEEVSALEVSTIGSQPKALVEDEEPVASEREEAATLAPGAPMETSFSYAPEDALDGDQHPTLELPDALEPETTRSAAPRPSVIVLRTRAPHPIVCWELHRDAPPPGSRWELRCFGFNPLRASVDRRELVLPVTERRGSHQVEGFDFETRVRVALGVASDDGFAPLAIASELSVDAGRVELRFRPPLASAEPITIIERALATEFSR